MYSYIPVMEWEAFKNTSTQRECVYKNEKGTKKNNENNNDLYDVHEHFNIYDGFLKWVLHEKIVQPYEILELLSNLVHSPLAFDMVLMWIGEWRATEFYTLAPNYV